MERCCRNVSVSWMVIVVMVLLLTAGSAVAQNLVTNGTFDNDIDGWWQWTDSIKLVYRGDVGSTLTGGSGPGSMEVQLYVWSGGGQGPIQEVPVTAGVSYTLGCTGFIPDSEDNVANVATLLLLWVDADNQSVGSGEMTSNAVWERGKWVRISAEVVAPSGAVRAQVQPIVSTPNLENETRPGIAYFDDIELTAHDAPGMRQVLFIPAAASAHGRNGTVWTTRGWFANRTGVPVEISAALLRQGQENLSALSHLTGLGTVPPDGFLEVQDIVAKLGGSGMTGAIYIEAMATGDGLPETLVEATTYTSTPNPFGAGAFGQGVPGTKPGTKTTVVIPGVFQGDDYRTNVGAINTSPSQLTLKVEVTGGDGTLLGSATWTFQPYEQRQASVGSLGVGSASGGTVTFSRVGDSGSFRAYVTVVDQHSGDAVYTPGP